MIKYKAFGEIDGVFRMKFGTFSFSFYTPPLNKAYCLNIKFKINFKGLEGVFFFYEMRVMY